MNASERRSHILSTLKNSEHAVSASTLAKAYAVSRQIIVGDVALLRAAGEKIIATPRGYIYEPENGGQLCHISCKHDASQMQAELNAIVDEGCTVVDVIVEHPLYGEITGVLNLASRHDVDMFIKKSAEEASVPISTLTDGIHLHTLRCPDADACARVHRALTALGILMEG
ncbi:MAG: transcription repressor NadR [Peptococcaceae bacterium]|nr:transcription repressor NadR [Peptococcaceae bacterium]